MMMDASTDGMDDLIARTRTSRVTAEQMDEIATAFETIGTERSLTHAALARIRADALRGIIPRDFAAIDAVGERFRAMGDTTGEARALFFRAWAKQTAGRFTEALDDYAQCMALFQQLNDVPFIAGVHTQIGTIHIESGNVPAALIEYNVALALYREINDPIGIAGTMSNIGTIHLSVNDLDRAFLAFNEAIPLHEANNDAKYLATTLNNLAVIYYYRSDIARAVELFVRVLELRQQLGEPVAIITALGSLAEGYLAMGDVDTARTMLASIDPNDNPDPHFRIDMITTRARLLVHEADVEAACTLYLQALAMATDFALPSRQIGLHRELRNLAQQQSDLAAYIEHNTSLNALTERFSGASTARQLTEIESKLELEAREREHQKHMAVLHSTLPKQIAERVARGETVTDTFENASVIFLDIVGFTTLSAGMSSEDVISLLDDVFTQCDAICAKHSVTKVKTIGDSYMCVSFDNVINAARCALEMVKIESRIKDQESNQRMLQFRIGIHCGPVTAGVIGKERMQYDVWGDTVNVASRMESSGEAGRVHVSEAFAANLQSNTEYRIQNSMSESDNQESHEVPLVTSHSSLVTTSTSLVTIERGSFDIKGKGMMKTYWLESSTV